MNFVQLCDTTRIECGVSGSIATAQNVSGETQRIVNWVAQAWNEIQLIEPEWRWMRKTAQFNTTANKGDYDPVADIGLSDFSFWRPKSFRSYLTSAGVGSECLLGYKDYDAFRNYYLLSSRKTTYSRPTEMTIAPNNHVLLGLAPNDIYTVTGDYYSLPTALVNDADIPNMPLRFHMLIVYLAKRKYGAFESAPEVYDSADKDYNRMLNELQFDQGSRITRGGALI